MEGEVIALGMFRLAQDIHRREIRKAAVSGAIALGTALSLVTLSVLFLFMDAGLI